MMHGKIKLMILSFCLAGMICTAQEEEEEAADTVFSDEDMAELFNELDALLDSLSRPKSFFLVNLGMGSGYFSQESKSTMLPEAVRKTTFTPSVSYYAKAGWGLGASAVVVHDGRSLNPYQFYATASYDYLKKPSLITGIAFTRFITKDSVPFYTSPLKNEVYAYFTYKKFWLKPSIALSYGWGSREDFEKREEQINIMRLARNGYTHINTRESIHDFNVITSLRHDFYWFDIAGKNDYIRFTPQLVFTSGTQKFGFNQSSSSYAILPRTGANYLYNTDQFYLDDQLYFQPLSLATYIKAEYSKGKFFIQPQLVFDYYFLATDKKLITAFLMQAGVIF